MPSSKFVLDKYQENSRLFKIEKEYNDFLKFLMKPDFEDLTEVSFYLSEFVARILTASLMCVCYHFNNL